MINENVIIKDLVSENFRTAEVFEKFGIDFCCKGNRPLKQACDEKNLNYETVKNELENANSTSNSDNNKYDLWDLDYLAQYIVNNHHKYVLKAIPVISEHLSRVVNAHSKHHPYIKEVAALFSEVQNELLQHMQKEEKVLFPIVNKLAAIKREGKSAELGNFSIKMPIAVMEREHENAGSALERIRTITNNFTLPEDACTTFAVTYKELDEFEKDLHKHVFLENSILFPKAIELENELTKN